MRTLPAFVGLLIFIGIGACSTESSTPSEQDARRALENMMERKKTFGSKVNQAFAVVSFKKTDGILGERSGAKLYTLEFESEWRGLVDWNNISVAPGDRRLKKGELYKVTGTVEFIKTEKGWRANFVSCEIEEGGRSIFCDIRPPGFPHKNGKILSDQSNLISFGRYSKSSPTLGILAEAIKTSLPLFPPPPMSK